MMRRDKRNEEMIGIKKKEGRRKGKWKEAKRKHKKWKIAKIGRDYL